MLIDTRWHLLADEVNAGFKVTFTHELRFGRLEPMLETAIFRIVQEALNNAKQHGRVDRAAVQLNHVDDWLEIVVRDEGVGFDQTDIALDRFGLKGIQERAHLFATMISEGESSNRIESITRHLVSDDGRRFRPVAHEPLGTLEFIGSIVQISERLRAYACPRIPPWR